MTEDTRHKSPKVEGEGSYSGAREYDRGAEKTAKSGKVTQKAKEAKRAVEGPDGADLARAEEEGKRHSYGEDPALRHKKAGQ
jgi:hypothetical protein